MQNTKTAIVTGGAQGIGKIISKTLLEHKINVIIFENDKAAGEETINEFSNFTNLRFEYVDVSDETQVIKGITNAVKHFGNIDYLINNAAIINNKNILNLSVSEWQRVIDVNLTGAFICSKYTYQHLKKTNGTIINMCSTRAFMSEPDTEAYSASKGGIFALTHAMAMSMGPEVSVNCISPGWIDVTMHKKESKKQPCQARKEDHEQHPAGRIGKAEDIANMVMFLIHPQNDFITGQNFIVDGGMTRKMIYV